MSRTDSSAAERRILELEAKVKQLELALETVTQSRDELNEIFTLSLDLLCIADINTASFLKVNPAFVSRLGYSESELINRSFLDFVHPDDVESTIRIIEDQLKAGTKVINFTNRYRCADGSDLWLDWVSHPLPARGLAFAAAHDITRLKQMEQALLENESFIHSVMDHLPLGIAVNRVEPVVDFYYMNDNFPQFYRTTREALADPNNFWEAVYEDPDFREQMKKRVVDDCATGITEKMVWNDIPIRRRGRETRYISARNTPLPDKGLMISTVWDVTASKQAELERQRLQEQLASAQKMESIGRLAGGVAHDFNNMLGVILGRADLIQNELAPNHPAMAGIREIINAAERSARLTQQLLAFARKQTVKPAILELNTVVDGMLGMLRRLIGENITLTFRPGPELWRINMDPGQIDQIMANLCVNARDAIEGVGLITIETKNVFCQDKDGFLEATLVPGDYVLLTVTDSGAGMNEEVRKHLFDPFFTTKGLGEGTGLGLSTVYGIVKQNGGFINVYSEPGKGSIFRIYFPRHSGASEKKENPQRASGIPLDGIRATVLLVEDDHTNLGVCTAMLRELGYNVLSAASPGEAITLAKTHEGEINLFITDVIMPEMNGRELIEQLTAIRPGVKRLFMSGYTADIIAHHGVLEDGVSFLQKPFSLNTLAAKVQDVLRE